MHSFRALTSLQTIACVLLKYVAWVILFGLHMAWAPLSVAGNTGNKNWSPHICHDHGQHWAVG